MKFLKNFFVFFLALLLAILVSISCHAGNKKRDLSTPSSRLIGWWQDTDGVRYYFGTVNESTEIGSFTTIFPDKLKVNCSYEVLSQNMQGARIKVKFHCEGGSSLPSELTGLDKVTYYVEKDGSQMMGAIFVPSVGKIINPIPLKYIDSKRSSISRSESIFGTYLNEDTPGEYLELKSDGTFFLRESRISYWGRYEIKNDVLTIKLESGLAARGKIVGNMIIDDDDEVWVKS